MAITQGFRQFRQVADIVLKAPDATVFGAGRRKLAGGGGGFVGMLAQKIFKIEHSEMPFSAFLEPRNQFPSKA